MPEGYKVYKSSDFIRKTAEGQLDLQQSLHLVRELATASGFHKKHDLLIDLRETEPFESYGDLLTVSVEFARFKDVFSNKIAFIIPNTPERKERASFFKISLRNANFQIQYFTEFEEAIDWLSTIKKFPDNS